MWNSETSLMPSDVNVSWQIMRLTDVKNLTMLYTLSCVHVHIHTHTHINRLLLLWWYCGCYRFILVKYFTKYIEEHQVDWMDKYHLIFFFFFARYKDKYQSTLPWKLNIQQPIKLVHTFVFFMCKNKINIYILYNLLWC